MESYSSVGEGLGCEAGRGLQDWDGGVGRVSVNIGGGLRGWKSVHPVVLGKVGRLPRALKLERRLQKSMVALASAMCVAWAREMEGMMAGVAEECE